MAPEGRCLEKVESKGFTDQFMMKNSALLCLSNQKTYLPEQVEVVNYYRFEGISDPDDMSIMYAIETSDGHKGTLIDAYGIYANDAVGQFMNKTLNFHKQTHRDWS